MTDLLSILTPELILAGFACVLFLLGCSDKLWARTTAPFLTLLALLATLAITTHALVNSVTRLDSFSQSLRLDHLANYIRFIASAIGILLLLLSWPTRTDRTGNSALVYEADGGEYFGLFLLSIAGLFLVSSANNLIILFLALELVSIPNYIMISISRRISAAQEAGVKYFFLGALSVALMLFGFSYLYGTTGQINFAGVADKLQATIRATGTLPSWQMLGVLLVLAGFAYKMAAFPLHFYAGDVYEGAATPVTAFLAFVPKAAGFVATIKLLAIIGGPTFQLLPPTLITLLAVVAAITMSVGNVLALLQNNVKRVLAYSSVAHSGYMLVGLACLHAVPQQGLGGVLFYLAAYGVMNTGAFGVLMLLPARDGRDDAAETFDDLAGQGRRHVGLGLAMAICCFSLIGIPLTVGFLGKLLLIKPALSGGLTWLAIVLIINAAISAAYYLRIVAAMFLRTDGPAVQAPVAGIPATQPQLPVRLGVALSVLLTFVFGAVPPAAQLLTTNATPPLQSSTQAPTEPAIAAAPRIASLPN